jgi:hypothetical protein
LPDFGVCTRRFEGRNTRLVPSGRRGPKPRLERRSRRFWRDMVEVSRSVGGQEDDLLSQCLAKYRPHRPYGLECCCLQGFLAGGIVAGHRPQTVGYRPPRQIPPVDRLPGNEPFCRVFSSIYLPRSMRSILCEFFPDGLYCWVKCASACILLPGQCPYTCPATTFTPTGVSAGAARNGAPRGGVGRDNSARRRLVCASQTQQTTGIPLAAPHSV